MYKIKAALYLSALFPCVCYGADRHVAAAVGGDGTATAMASISTVSAAGHHLEINDKSIAALEDFLRSNIGKDYSFPEEQFTAFVKPFTEKFSSLKKRDRLKAQNEAAKTISIITELAYTCFANLQQTQNKLLVLEEFGSIETASREDVIRVYCEKGHHVFLIFQQALNKILTLDSEHMPTEAKHVLDSPFGISKYYGIAWLKDGNGIVPVHLTSKTTGIDLDYITLPYGVWTNQRGEPDYLRRAFALQKAVLQPSPCFIFQYNAKDSFIKTLFQNGVSGGFVTSSITARTGLGLSFSKYILSDIVKHIEGDLYASLIVLPDNEAEDQEFEAAFLEELQDAAKESDPFSTKFLECYGQYLIADGKAEAVRVADSATEAVTFAVSEVASSVTRESTLQNYIDSLYEGAIITEQAAVPAAVEGSTSRKLKPIYKKKNKGKGKPKATGGSGTTATAAAVEESALAAKAEIAKAGILAELKTRGRIKWRDLVKVVRLTLSDAFKEEIVSLHVGSEETSAAGACSAAAVTTGSHITLHLKGSKASDGITLVRPHGRDRTLSAGEARNFAAKLVDLTYKLIGGR